MHTLFQNSEELKRSIIALLFTLQNADGIERDSESVYIRHVARQIGVALEDLTDIRANKELYPLRPPADEPSRMTILYYLLFFIKSDNQITPEEEKLVQEFGFILGFRTDLTSDLIQIVKSYVDERVPPEEMLEKIKVYLN